MSMTDSPPVAGGTFGGPLQALSLAASALDYVRGCDLDGAECGELLAALGEVQGKLTATQAGLLQRFDAADAHDADGYGSSSAWLAAKAGMTKQAARNAVREMRLLR